MNRFVGFIFTAGPIEYLNQKGFSFHSDESNMDKGYKAFKMFLIGANCIEIRMVHDEQLYEKCFRIKHFEPFIDVSFEKNKCLESGEVIFSLNNIVSPKTCLSKEFNQFLKIRKEFELRALWLQCSDFESLKLHCENDQILVLNGRSAILFRMGPNCFDILVSK